MVNSISSRERRGEAELEFQATTVDPELKFRPTLSKTKHHVSYVPQFVHYISQRMNTDTGKLSACPQNSLVLSESQEMASGKFEEQCPSEADGLTLNHGT